MIRLQELRAQQRVLSRLDMADKSFPGQFGLLVIPVDFADERLAEDWNPATQLLPSLHDPAGPSLAHYFRVASVGNLDLVVTMVPVVHLAEERSQYSDVGYNGYTRTRKLARESLAGALASGVEFRRLDLQGGDGQVDGVLILHAGIGQENDTVDGLIQPLQFYLEEPVEDDGIQATTYAVASLRSGLGIWAHETGHLLGMEDRYDPRLHPVAGGVDVRSLGGLGRFSLMSSGAWGTGAGTDPALPDAYNALQLGWIEERSPQQVTAHDLVVEPWLETGYVDRVLAPDSPEGEFFLLETRDPAATTPYDAGLEEQQLLVIHVDENVPEGYFLEDGDYGYHLRARLVEADGDDLLRAGENDGTSSDLFPGSLGVTALTPFSDPSSQGYGGPTQVRLENIRQEDGAIALTVSSGDVPYVPLVPGVELQDNGTALLTLGVWGLEEAIDLLEATVTIFGAGGGTFSDGETVTTLTLVPEPNGYFISAEATLVPPATPEAGVETLVQVLPSADGVTLPAIVTSFTWLQEDDTFAIQQTDWPMWEERFPAGNTDTRWRHWNGPPYLTTSGTPVLACVAEGFETSEAWPDVRYANSSRAVLVSPPLDPSISLVRLTHAVEVEFKHAGTMMDGATVWWENGAGERHLATSLEDFDGVIDPGSSNPLRGISALGDSVLVLNDQDQPEWRVDTFGVPDARLGPWRLVLDFASNGLWAGRGWFIANIEGLGGGSDAYFDLQWQPRIGDCSGLLWDWPLIGSPLSDFQIQAFDETNRVFTELADLAVHETSCFRRYVVTARDLQQALQWDGNRRHSLRVRATGPEGVVVSRPVFVYPDGGPDPIQYLEYPYPNPSREAVKFRVEWPGPGLATVGVYDLRGRLLHEQDLGPGRQQLVWDGKDPGGRPAASGTYFLRLEGSGRIVTRKVVLLR